MVCVEVTFVETILLAVTFVGLKVVAESTVAKMCVEVTAVVVTLVNVA